MPWPTETPKGSILDFVAIFCYRRLPGLFHTGLSRWAEPQMTSKRGSRTLETIRSGEGDRGRDTRKFVPMRMTVPWRAFCSVKPSTTLCRQGAQGGSRETPSQRWWPGQKVRWRRRVCQRRLTPLHEFPFHVGGHVELSEHLVHWGRSCLCDPCCVVTQGCVPWGTRPKKGSKT